MKKLVAATLLALLLPVFWAVGAKAQTVDHSHYWTQTADTAKMKPQQRQTYQIRAEILAKADAMKNLYRMMSASSSHLETAKGLSDAAEQVRSQSLSTVDYFELESQLESVTAFHSAMRALNKY